MRRLASALLGLSVLASPALVSPVLAQTVDKAVRANSRTAIGGFLGYEVDTCYTSMIPDAKVRQAPANGNLQIVPHEQVLGKDSRCPGTKVRGIAYVYTPKRDFRGSDEVSIDVPWAGNDTSPMSVRTYTYRITVQ